MARYGHEPWMVLRLSAGEAVRRDLWHVTGRRDPRLGKVRLATGYRYAFVEHLGSAEAGEAAQPRLALPLVPRIWCCTLHFYTQLLLYTITTSLWLPSLGLSDHLHALQPHHRARYDQRSRAPPRSTFAMVGPRT